MAISHCAVVDKKTDTEHPLNSFESYLKPLGEEESDDQGCHAHSQVVSNFH